MLQINPFLDCTVYSGIVVHIGRNSHDIPFYKDTLRIPNITKYTFHSSGLIRQGLMTREQALQKEATELKKKDPPEELLTFLGQNKIGFDDYVNAVTSTDKSKFEPRLQKVARDIYHRFRRF